MEHLLCTKHHSEPIMYNATHVILTGTTLWGGNYYYSHFTSAKTEAEKKVTQGFIVKWQSQRLEIKPLLSRAHM